MNTILDALKSKFEGVSVKQLEVKANSMAKKGLTVADVENITLESVIDAYADFRTNTATDKLKSEHAAAIAKLNGGSTATELQPTKGGNEVTGGDLNESEVIKEIKALVAQQQETIKALQKGSEDSAKAQLQSQRLAEMTQLASVLNENLRAPYLLGDFAAMDDTAYAAHKTAMQTSIDAAVQFSKAQGSSFQLPSGGGGMTSQQVSLDEVKSIMGIPTDANN